MFFFCLEFRELLLEVFCGHSTHLLPDILYIYMVLQDSLSLSYFSFLLLRSYCSVIIAFLKHQLILLLSGVLLYGVGLFVTNFSFDSLICLSLPSWMTPVHDLFPFLMIFCVFFPRFAIIGLPRIDLLFTTALYVLHSVWYFRLDSSFLLFFADCLTSFHDFFYSFMTSCILNQAIRIASWYSNSFPFCQLVILREYHCFS